MLNAQADLRGKAHDLGHPSEADHRRALGIYYTPTTTAEILARWAVRDQTDSILEPSFGGCALLEAAISRLSALGCPDPATQLIGFDVDPAAFIHLNRLLGDRDTHPNFARRDFLSALREEHRGFVKAVISNPPYIAYHRMSLEQRGAVRRWRELNAPTFPMTASLWAYFIDHALSFLATSGRLAFVLPASIITADYSKPIMSQLSRYFERVLLLCVNEQLFLDMGAEERTVVLLAEGYQPRGSFSAVVTMTTVRSVQELESTVETLLSPCNGVDSSESAMRDVRTIVGASHAQGDLCTLGDIVTVRIGEVVGDTPFFVKTSSEWAQAGVDSQCLTPIITRTRQVRGLRLTKRDVTSVSSSIPLLLRPTGSRLSKSVKRYLEEYPADALSSNCTFSKRDPWYRVSYDNTAKAFIGSLSHLGPRIMLNSAGVSCANGLYKLAPIAVSTKWRVSLAAAALSSITQFSAEVLARTRGAGALKLEPSDVARLLVPTSYLLLSAEQSRHLVNRADSLLRRGKPADASDLVDQTLLISPGIMSQAQLDELRSAIVALRDLRLIRKLKIEHT